MGAEVIKVEGLDGDPIRRGANPAVGSPEGPSFLHLRWNRGKKSVGLDLKSPDGAAVFKRLASKCDIAIDGMRAGVLERLGLGYEVLSRDNQRLVFCSISGLGLTGPYHTLGSHGPSFDAFGALGSTNPMALTPEEQAKSEVTMVGMHAVGLYAALGVLAAVIHARQTGKGAMIEVSAAEAAAHWKPDGVNVALNQSNLFERPGFLGGDKRLACWPRLYRYNAKDGKGIFFQAFAAKFWKRFCDAIGRADLFELYQSDRDVAEIDHEVHAELCKIMATRTRAQWMELFIEFDVPGGPANTERELASDPHFLARDNVYETDVPGAGRVRLTTSPVKTPNQTFAPGAAPDQWQHTDEVLSSLLELDAAEIQRLRSARAVY
jgi:crotonobetainyl-CoA:carnitine CoA-transferase CaiB-like acyl-CoA transferase